jgi:ABC-type transport system involved in multi-copper enzyme maturation permease subunit
MSPYREALLLFYFLKNSFDSFHISSIFFILRVNAGCVILSNLAALLNELDSASMTNAFILDNSCFIITPENGSDDFGWLAVKNFNCI